jgi:molecular chaperone DnaK (HSP70)
LKSQRFDQRQRDFYHFVEGQTIVDIHVLQGERARERQSKLGRFCPQESTDGGRHPRIEVNSSDANGMLNVSAMELRTGQEQSIEVADYGLSKTEVERMIRDQWCMQERFRNPHDPVSKSGLDRHSRDRKSAQGPCGFYPEGNNGKDYICTGTVKNGCERR